MNLHLYFVLIAGIVPFAYFLLSLSPNGGWKTAGSRRRWAFHFSWVIIVFLQITLVFGGLGKCLISAPFYSAIPLLLINSIASAIIIIELIGVVVKKSSAWHDRKRLHLVITASLIILLVQTAGVIISRGASLSQQ